LAVKTQCARRVNACSAEFAWIVLRLKPSAAGTFLQAGAGKGQLRRLRLRCGCQVPGQAG
jgi:hypothetical protein